MTAPLPAGLDDLERWAVEDGFMTIEEVLARREPVPVRRDPAADGRAILSALRERGLTVRLGDDGRPRVGPRDRVDEADLTILAVHRAELLAALHAERGEAP